MATPQGTIKSWWKARSRRWRPIVDWMNQVGAWCNRFDVQSPLILSRENGTVSIGLATRSGQVLEHPWRITVYPVSGTDMYSVAGGRVHDGLTWVLVAGIAETALPGTDLCVWLRLKYWNSTTAVAEAEIKTGAAFEASDYEADVLPAGDPLVRPTSGWVEVIVPIGIISAAGEVTQYLFEDQVIPHGLTYSVPRTIAWQYADDKLQAINVTETYVRGVLRAMTDPVAVEVVETGDCP
jgi:hypothetical protein